MDRLWQNRKTEATGDAAAQEEPFKEYVMTLQEERPLSVKFGDNTIKLTLHIAELKSGDRTFEEWDVTGTYRPETAEGRVRLTREGKLEMLPADFTGRLDQEQVAQRTNLEKELEGSRRLGRSTIANLRSKTAGW